MGKMDSNRFESIRHTESIQLANRTPVFSIRLLQNITLCCRRIATLINTKWLKQLVWLTCALENHIFLFNQHSVSYLLASQMSCVIYIINNTKLSYHSDSADPQSLRRSRSFKVIDFGTNRKPVFDLLLVNNTNLHPVSHRFQVTAQ